MSRAAALLLLTSSAAVLLAARRTSAGAVEAGDALGGFALDAIADRASTLVNVLTEQEANVDTATANRNIRAFLTTLAMAEGTEGRGGYRACYGYRHTIQSYADHPAVTREWLGERLSDDMCRKAGFSPGCRSTAAGRYQLIKPTWLELKGELRLPDFSRESQDAAAIHQLKRKGALEDVKAGRFAAAVGKVRSVWASLPGNYAGQGQRSMEQLAGWFLTNGGSITA